MVLFILNLKNDKAAERGNGFTHYIACCFKVSAEEGRWLSRTLWIRIGFSEDRIWLMSQIVKFTAGKKIDF
jgi:hypothetical protein